MTAFLQTGRRARGLRAGALLLMFLLSGCGFFGAGAERAQTPEPTRTPLPTFTPTAPPPTGPPSVEPAQESTAPPAETETAPTAAPTTASTAPPAAEPRLTIDGDLVNLRSGPGVAFELVGSAALGETFGVVGRNAAGDWWQVCCVNGAQAWVFGELAQVENAEAVALAAEPALPPPSQEQTEPIATPAPTSEPAATAFPMAAPDPAASSAGVFDPNAQYLIVHFKVLGLDENNGGIRDSGAQHHIFLTVLDANGAGVDGAVVRNLVGDKSEVVTGSKGPGKAEITMYYEPFKLTVVSDPTGPVTSQVSNQMGLIFPHLSDLVGKLGDVNYEYGACPTLEIRCQWPLAGIHFSYEITFQQVK